MVAMDRDWMHLDQQWLFRELNQASHVGELKWRQPYSFGGEITDIVELSPVGTSTVRSLMKGPRGARLLLQILNCERICSALSVYRPWSWGLMRALCSLQVQIQKRNLQAKE